MGLDANHRPPVHDLVLLRGSWVVALTLAGTFWAKVEIATELRYVPSGRVSVWLLQEIY